MTWQEKNVLKFVNLLNQQKANIKHVNQSQQEVNYTSRHNYENPDDIMYYRQCRTPY